MHTRIKLEICILISIIISNIIFLTCESEPFLSILALFYFLLGKIRKKITALKDMSRKKSAMAKNMTSEDFFFPDLITEKRLNIF